MSYSCSCGSGYGGFFDEVTKFFQTATPIVGGISGAATGYEQGGIGGAITGSMQGISTGIKATQPQVIYQQTIPTRPTITSAGSPVTYYDSLLGTQMQQSYPNTTYYVPAPAAASTDPMKIYVVAGLGFAALLGILLFRKL